MPSRDYYLGDSDHMKAIRAKYAAHVAAMFRLAGFDDADARAARVIALEHSIAENHISMSDIEDIAKANNLWKRSDFAAKAPGHRLGRILRSRGPRESAGVYGVDAHRTHR